MISIENEFSFLISSALSFSLSGISRRNERTRRKNQLDASFFSPLHSSLPFFPIPSLPPFLPLLPAAKLLFSPLPFRHGWIDRSHRSTVDVKNDPDVLNGGSRRRVEECAQWRLNGMFSSKFSSKRAFKIIIIIIIFSSNIFEIVTYRTVFLSRQSVSIHGFSKIFRGVVDNGFPTSVFQVFHGGKFFSYDFKIARETLISRVRPRSCK